MPDIKLIEFHSIENIPNEKNLVFFEITLLKKIFFS